MTVSPAAGPVREPDLPRFPYAPDRATVAGGRRARAVQSVLMFAMVAGTLVLLFVTTGAGLSAYGLVTLTYLSVKLLLAVSYRPATAAPPVATVAAVIPVYNEDPATFKACLDSILEQSHPIDCIYVVDDGSDSLDCLLVAVEATRGRPDAVVTRLERNRGKRHAQAWAFEQLTCDLVLTVDSDTVLHRDAVHEALRAFADPAVQAVTGNVQAWNASTNLLTRLTSLRYVNAFLWERAAYSAVGSVLCACGSFSMWRRSLITDHLADYLDQTFLGTPVGYGDDRRLTNYALTRGKVVLQDTAIAYTTVPERMKHYANQQLRWNKSFFRETFWALRTFRAWRPVWLLSFAELALWVAFTLIASAVLVLYPIITGNLPSPWYLAFVALMAYGRSVRYLGSQRTTLRSQLAVYALAPLYGALYILVLTPIRLWSLVSLRSPDWGTRRTVEVRWPTPVAASDPGSAPLVPS